VPYYVFRDVLPECNLILGSRLTAAERREENGGGLANGSVQSSPSSEHNFVRVGWRAKWRIGFDPIPGFWPVLLPRRCYPTVSCQVPEGVSTSGEVLALRTLLSSTPDGKPAAAEMGSFRNAGRKIATGLFCGTMLKALRVLEPPEA
jgi:hypothetical protein